MKVYRHGKSNIFLLKDGQCVLRVMKSIYPDTGSLFILRDGFLRFDNEESSPLTFLLVFGKTPEQVIEAAKEHEGHDGAWIL